MVFVCEKCFNSIKIFITTIDKAQSPCCFGSLPLIQRFCVGIYHWFDMKWEVLISNSPSEFAQRFPNWANFYQHFCFFSQNVDFIPFIWSGFYVYLVIFFLEKKLLEMKSFIQSTFTIQFVSPSQTKVEELRREKNWHHGFDWQNYFNETASFL